MITEQQLDVVLGSKAVGPDGKLGTVSEVYLDDETGRPEWATVRTGMFGTKEAVPVERVRLDTETVTERQTVTEAVRKEQIELDTDDTVRRS
jgi:hypothetical protein